MEITDRKRADDRLRLLAEAGELFSSSLDRDEIAARIAQVAVPRLADSCNVYVASADSLERVACVNNDPRAAAAARVAAVQLCARGRGHGMLARVSRPTEPVLFSHDHGGVPGRARPSGRRPGDVRRDRHPLADARSDRRPRPVARGPDTRLASVRSASTSTTSTSRRSSRDGRRSRSTARSSSARSAARTGRAGARVRRRRGLPRRARRRRPPLEPRRRRASPGWRRRVIAGARRGRRARAVGRSTQAGERPQTFPFDGPGGELWLSLTAAEFPQGTVYAFRDLTEERAVEQLKSDFVSTVSHELRTPLAAIYGAAMTLQARRRLARRRPAGGDARRDRRRVGTARPDRQRHPAGEPARLGRARTFDRRRPTRAEIARAVLAAAETHLPAGIELVLTAPGHGCARAGGPGRAAPGARQPGRERRQVLARAAVGSSSRWSRRTGACASPSATAGSGSRPPSTSGSSRSSSASTRTSRAASAARASASTSRREIVRRMGGRIRVESERGAARRSRSSCRSRATRRRRP